MKENKECKYISIVDSDRIKGDACLAVDSLKAIIYEDESIHKDYLKEKVETAQRCIDFMKSFYEEENE